MRAACCVQRVECYMLHTATIILNLSIARCFEPHTPPEPRLLAWSPELPLMLGRQGRPQFLIPIPQWQRRLFVPYSFLSHPPFLTRFAPQLGALLAIYGILVKLMPLLFPAPGAHGGDGGTESGAATVPWIALLVFSQGFNAASNVYKEIALKGVDLDEWYVRREEV